jgi:hypothetical protein
MAIVNGSLELGYKNLAWFNANPTLVLKEGQIVYLQQTGTYKIGNGTSTLSALSFLGISSETQTLQNVTDLGSTTTNSITANGFVKSGGTASQFLKANGSVDSTTYLSTQVVPVGGTTGQILAKVDDTDYNLEWIENYANYTSVLKHTVKASVALTKGQAVYVSGASGTNMLVSKASNVSEATSSKTLGLIAQNLAINGNGFVITEGLLSGLNTNSATIGDAVWLGVDGALIYGLASKPYAPAHLVFIGIVTRVSATVGEIFVKVQNGFELNEIHDVDLKTTLPSNNEILTYESSTGLWKNKSVISALGFTPYNSTNPSNYISGITSGMVTTALGFTPYNSTNPSGYITGITSGNVTTALGFTPYNATNPSGYITSSALTPYAPIDNPTFTTAITTPIVNGVSGTINFNNAVQTSGAITPFRFTKPNNTTQTASTQINGFVVNGGTRQWATGNITTQSENVWGATTYSFVGASTITNAYGNVFSAPVAGTNCTITNNFAAQFNGQVQITGSTIGLRVNNPAGGVITIGQNSSFSFVNEILCSGRLDFGSTTSQLFMRGTEIFFTGQTITERIGTAFSTATQKSSYSFPMQAALWNGTSQSMIYSGFAHKASTTVNLASRFSAIVNSFDNTNLNTSGTEALTIFSPSANVLLAASGSSTFTDAGFRLDVQGTGRFQNTLTLATGTTSIAPLKLIAGTNLTTPVNGSFEFDGTNLYFTVGGVRKTVTLI